MRAILLIPSKNKIKCILPVLLILAIPALGFSESKIYNLEFEHISKNLLALSSQPRPKKVNDDCHQMYSELYNDNTLRVSIFLGVMNTTNNNCIDPPAKQALTEYLIKDCSSDFFACGFTKTSDEPITLQKKTDDSKNIIINIHDSSASESVKINTVDLASEQQIKSDKTTNLFFESIKNNDIIFYLGHSRYGTGPGFYLLPFFSKKWLSTYIQEPIKSAMVRNFNQTSWKPKLFGLFSCSSERFYAKELRNIAPDMALIVSTGITDYYSNITEAVGILNSIFGDICLSKANGILKNNKTNSKYKLYGLSGSNIFQKFKKNNSIFAITIFLLMLPVLIIATSKMFIIKTCSPFETKFFLKDMISVLVVFLISFVGIKYFSEFNNDIYRQSIPIFFIVAGIFLLVIFSYKKNIKSYDIKLISKTSIAPLLVSMLIYFWINIYPTADGTQLVLSIIQSIKLLLLFIAVLPFVIFTTGLLQYPLFLKNNMKLIFRILLFIIVAEFFCMVTSCLFAMFNVFLIEERSTMFVVLFFTQLVSLLLYFYKSNTLLPVLYLSLTLAIIFSENIHGLFYY